VVFLAAGLAIAAWRAEARGTKIWLVICCTLNLVAAVKMIANDFPYAYRLLPDTGRLEPAYHRD
jgi:hypothetical protein